MLFNSYNLSKNIGYKIINKGKTSLILLALLLICSNKSFFRYYNQINRKKKEIKIKLNIVRLYSDLNTAI